MQFFASELQDDKPYFRNIVWRGRETLGRSSTNVGLVKARCGSTAARQLFVNAVFGDIFAILAKGQHGNVKNWVSLQYMLSGRHVDALLMTTLF